MNISADHLKLAAAIILPHIPPYIITRFDGHSKSLREWYPYLKFPAIRLPRSIFGPAWVFMYTSMGYASYIVYMAGGGFQGPARIPLALYAAQLALVSFYRV